MEILKDFYLKRAKFLKNHNGRNCYTKFYRGSVSAKYTRIETSQD